MKLAILFLLSLLSIVAASQPGGKQYQFRRIGIENGLSHNQVNAIIKDMNGFMWVGTMSGLDRYDGYSFKTFKHDSRDSTSIDDDYVGKLLELPDGKLWVETKKWLNIYDPVTETFSHNITAYLAAMSLPTTALVNTIKVSNGDFYFLFAQHGIFKYNARNRQTIKISERYNGRVDITSMAKDLNEDIWWVKRDGMIEKADGKTGRVVYSSKMLASQMNNQLLNYILFVDAQRELWIRVVSETLGVFHFNPALNQLRQFNKESGTQRLNTNIIKGILQDNQSRIWICTDHGGINILDKKDYTIRYIVNSTDDNNSLSQNSIAFSYKDNDGIIWIGTYRKGINCYHESIIKFPLYRHQPSNPTTLPYDDVNRFVEDKKGNLWIGTNGGGLIYFDRANSKFTRYLHQPGNANSLSADVIVSLLIDKQQKLWIGTYYGGLNCFDGKNFTHYKNNPADSNSISDNRIWELYEDDEGKLLVGTLVGGLDIMDRKTNTFSHNNTSKPNSIRSNYISAIAQNKQTDTWIGTTNGVDIFEKLTGLVVHYDYNPQQANSLSNSNVLCIYFNHSNQAWVGTREGLNLFNAKKKIFQHFGKEDGLPDNAILNILEDNQHQLWISTPKGISCVKLLPPDKNGLIKISCENYDETDGLQSREFNENAALKTAKGELIFGGPNGFNLFQPQSLVHDRQVPRLAFTGFRLFNETVTPGVQVNGKVLLPKAISQTNSIELNYDQNGIAIEFTALNYFDADKLKYAWKLEGLNDDWLLSDAKSRQAVFTNLDPGNYVFHVKTTKADGTLSNNEITLKIKIRPPFWKTPFAYGGYLLLIAAALYIGRIFIIRKTQRRFAIDQERQEAQRMHELDLMKIKFFTNVSHEFRTPLSLILAPVDKMLLQANEPSQKQQLNMVYRNARRLLNLVNQLLDFRKMEEKELKLQPRQGDIIQYMNDVSFFFSDVAEKKQISFSFHSNIDNLVTNFDHDKIERIIFNLLSNAFKFTPENGHVGIDIKASENLLQAGHYQLTIQVQDTGIGIESAKHEKIFERFFQNELPGSMVNQGSGIGLSITKEFIKLHGGTIRVESEVGKGSCFIIEMQVIAIATHTKNVQVADNGISQHAEPLMVADNEEVLALPEAQQNGIPIKATLKKQTLLLVEDNEDFLFYLKDNLKQHFTIVEAINGKLGWQKTLAAHPDLIVSDISMPEMTGTELCKKIKNDKRTQHIPVILLTALSGEALQLKSLETGANDYINKPFNFEILLSKIRNLLSQQEQSKKTYQKQVMANPTEIVVESPNEKFMQQLLALIEKKISDADFSVEEMSREMFMSRVALYKKVFSLTGKTPVEFLRQLRLQRSAQLLQKSNMTVSEVAYEVGFNNPKYFTKYFRQEFGLLPSAYIQQNRVSQ